MITIGQLPLATLTNTVSNRRQIRIHQFYRIFVHLALTADMEMEQHDTMSS